MFLLPAYASLWLAGRWYATRYRPTLTTLALLAAAAFVGAAVCELFTSDGFCFFSGRFAEPTFAEFSVRLAKYFPSYLGSLAFYVGIAAVVHTLLVLARSGAGAAARAEDGLMPWTIRCGRIAIAPACGARKKSWTRRSRPCMPTAAC